MLTELRVVHYEVHKRRAFLRRGKSVANVCVSFAALGLKSDQNSQLAMPHSSNSAHAYQVPSLTLTPTPTPTLDPNPNPDPDPDPNPNPAPARNPDPDPERPLYPPQAMGVYRKVRALYRNHIAPIVERYIGTILRPLLGLMYEHDVQLYVGQVSTFLTYLPP